jgi:hypothetical protein
VYESRAEGDAVSGDRKYTPTPLYLFAIYSPLSANNEG